ncbi:hypothetical protein L7F22_016241 [Adiantum nelumboides]|nr:hypothetical protein [Adiantum nelumboides]
MKWRPDALWAAGRRVTRSCDRLQGSCDAEEWGQDVSGAALIQKLLWSLGARGQICRPWLLFEVNAGLSVELAAEMFEIFESVQGSVDTVAWACRADCPTNACEELFLMSGVRLHAILFIAAACKDRSSTSQGNSAQIEIYSFEWGCVGHGHVSSLWQRLVAW